MAREIDHLALHAAELGDVLEHHDGAQGRRRRGRRWAPPNRARSTPCRPAQSSRACPGDSTTRPSSRQRRHGIGQRLAGDLVHDLEDLGHRAADAPSRPSSRSAARPPGSGSRSALRVGADDAVADRGQGHLGALLLAVEGLLGLLALGDVHGDADAADDVAVAPRSGSTRVWKIRPSQCCSKLTDSPREGQPVGADGRGVGVPGPVVGRTGWSPGGGPQPEGGDPPSRPELKRSSRSGGPDDGGHGLDQQPQTGRRTAKSRERPACGPSGGSRSSPSNDARSAVGIVDWKGRSWRWRA